MYTLRHISLTRVYSEQPTKELAGRSVPIVPSEHMLGGFDLGKYQQHPDIAKRSLSIMMRDNMYFQSYRARAGELGRSLLASVWGEASNRTHDLYMARVHEALAATDKTGSLHLVVYDKSRGYIVYDQGSLRNKAMTTPENTDITLWRQLLAGDEYKKTLMDIFGRDGLSGIGLYMIARGKSSRLLDGLSADRSTYILSFAEQIQRDLTRITGITALDLPRTTQALAKLGKGVEVRFDARGDFDFMATFAGKGLSPTELNQVARDIQEDYKKISDRGRDGLQKSTGSLHKLGMKGYSDITIFYSKKGAKNTDLLKDFDTLAIGVPLSPIQSQNLSLFIKENPSLRDEPITRELSDLMSLQGRTLSAARVLPQTRVIIDETRIATNNRAERFARRISEGDASTGERLQATGRIGEAREVQRQISEALVGDSDMNTLLVGLGMGSYEAIIADTSRLTGAIAILSSRSTPTVAETRLLSLLRQSYQRNREISEDIVTIERSFPPTERREALAYISAGLDKRVTSAEVARYAYESRYIYGNNDPISHAEEQIRAMPTGTSMQIPDVILPRDGNESSRETLSGVTLYAGESGKRSIIYDGQTLATLPIERIPGYIETMSDISWVGMSPLFRDLDVMQASISRHTGKQLSGSDGNYTTTESVRFLQVMCLVCLGELPPLAHDQVALRQALMSDKLGGRSVTEHFEGLIGRAQTKTDRPLWNKETRRIDNRVFDTKMREIASQIPS